MTSNSRQTGSSDARTGEVDGGEETVMSAAAAAERDEAADNDDSVNDDEDEDRANHDDFRNFFDAMLGTSRNHPLARDYDDDDDVIDSYDSLHSPETRPLPRYVEC